MCVLRRFKIYPLSKLQVYYTVSLTSIAILYMQSPELKLDALTNINQFPSPYPPPLLTTTTLFSAFMNLLTLSSTYVTSYNISSFCFAEHDILQVHPCCGKRKAFLLKAE